jgi:hypothetical protein
MEQTDERIDRIEKKNSARWITEEKRIMLGELCKVE